MPLTLNQQVRLRSDPRGLIFTVVSLFLEGDEHWCALQVGEAKSSKGARIHRPVAEVVTLAELAGEGGALSTDLQPTPRTRER